MQIPYKNTLTNTLRNNVFSHIMYQSSWHIKLAIPVQTRFSQKNVIRVTWDPMLLFYRW
jgi:hypothetical protein